VNEIMQLLNVQPGQTGLDATLGYGGHSLEILKRLLPGGMLYATDVDPFELPRTRERLLNLGYGEDVLKIKKMNFADVDQIATEAGPLNFVLADLGVSSMQIDNPDRGFSLKVNGPLDLRLNPKSGKPVSELLKLVSQKEIEEILFENADEPFAEVIAEAIKLHIEKGNDISTTIQLKEVIKGALHFLHPAERSEKIKKSWRLCFQALRIYVNDEFGVLEKFLEKLPYLLAPNARVAILTFHSGEDRRVKKSFQNYFRAGIYSDIATEPVRPSLTEISSNPRARSAKLRWAVKS
jgi:16S rRNA (cytosine1402-N4)-methyltransferase